MGVWIGVDVGGTKCAVVCAHPVKEGTPQILAKRQFPTCAHPKPKQAFRAFSDAINEMCAQLDAQPEGIGISCGGPLDSRCGVILSPPNLPGWDDVPIVDWFRDRYDVPVFLQNDANACAVAEWRFGAGRGCRDMLFLTFGTGLGAGLILDGRLYSGAADLAGEVGHIRLSPSGPVGYGKAGSFEGFCSGGGIARLAEEMLRAHLRAGGSTALTEDDHSARRIAELAMQGDAFCRSVYAICGEKLGEGLAILVDILNPERIVIGSIFARAESLLREGMERALRREALDAAVQSCAVVPAELVESLGDLAALGVLQIGLEGSSCK